MKIGASARKVGRYVKGAVIGVPVGIFTGARLTGMQASYVPTIVRDNSDLIYYNCKARPNAFLRKLESYAVYPSLYALAVMGSPVVVIANTADMVRDSVSDIAKNNGVCKTIKDNLENVKLMESFLQSQHEDNQETISIHKKECKL